MIAIKVVMIILESEKKLRPMFMVMVVDDISISSISVIIAMKSGDSNPLLRHSPYQFKKICESLTSRILSQF